MNIKLEKRQIILFTISIFICILIIVGVLFWKIFNSEETTQKNYGYEDIENLRSNFRSTFQNQVQTNEFVVPEQIKLEKDKDIVYTAYEEKKILEGKYELEISIPRININTNQINECNKKIEEIFLDKAKSIIYTSKISRTIYSVKYMAVVNKNVLSLVILSNLKEGQYPQREIIATYNYDFEAEKIITLEQALEKLNLDINEVESKIRKEVEQAQKQTEELKKLGYQNLYTRDLQSTKYLVKNTNNFFIGNDRMLYIIYAYGNNNLTNTTDLILIPIRNKLK